SLAVHAGQHLCIEVALIERGFAAPDHGSHDARKSFEAADGANGVGMLTRDRADLERQFRGGSQRVVPRLHGRRTGMRLLAVEGDGVALDAFCAEHDAEREPEAFEHWSLLYMQL